MLENSQDLFYLVMAFCVLWFTVFICIALYYLIKILRQSNQVVTEVREKLAMLTNVFSFLRSDLIKKTFASLIMAVKNNQAKNKNNKKQK